MTIRLNAKRKSIASSNELRGSKRTGEVQKHMALTERMIDGVAILDVSGHLTEIAGSLGPADDREPVVGDRIVFQRLDIDVHRAAAAECEAPDRILFEVVCADHRLAALEYLRRDFSHDRLEASTGQQALVGSILSHDDPRAFAAIRAPANANHGGDRYALPCLTGVVDRANEALIFPAVHRWTMAQTLAPGKQARFS
jgi:hypothetical protein